MTKPQGLYPNYVNPRTGNWGQRKLIMSIIAINLDKSENFVNAITRRPLSKKFAPKIVFHLEIIFSHLLMTQKSVNLDCPNKTILIN